MYHARGCGRAAQPLGRAGARAARQERGQALSVGPRASPMLAATSSPLVMRRASVCQSLRSPAPAPITPAEPLLL